MDIDQPHCSQIDLTMEDSLQLTNSENVPKDLAPIRASYAESKIESCIHVLQSWFLLSGA